MFSQSSISNHGWIAVCVNEWRYKYILLCTNLYWQPEESFNSFHPLNWNKREILYCIVPPLFLIWHNCLHCLIVSLLEILNSGICKICKTISINNWYVKCFHIIFFMFKLILYIVLFGSKHHLNYLLRYLYHKILLGPWDQQIREKGIIFRYTVIHTCNMFIIDTPEWDLCDVYNVEDLLHVC